mmetsp:Transcript_15522/g.34855  ORF Transcript_15522/g.34855 Transcript_15522/m.34855 type:complete len:132 (+) Transcript_15522:356-751(+)
MVLIRPVVTIEWWRSGEWDLSADQPSRHSRPGEDDVRRRGLSRIRRSAARALVDRKLPAVKPRRSPNPDFVRLRAVSLAAGKVGRTALEEPEASMQGRVNPKDGRPPRGERTVPASASSCRRGGLGERESY